MRSTMAALVLALGLLALATRADDLPPIPDRDLSTFVFDLKDLYRDEAAWEADRRAILAGIEAIGRVRDTMSRDAKGLADALDAVSDLRLRATKMTIYGELSANLDPRSAPAQRAFEVGEALVRDVEAAVAFVPERVLAIGTARLEEWLRAEPRLRRHRIRVNRLLAEAPLTRPANEQVILAGMAGWPQLSGGVFDALHAADLSWPVDEDASGATTPIKLGTLLGIAPARRPEAAKKLLQHLAPYEDVFGLLYTRRIEADLTIARHRGSADPVDALWLLRDGMPAGCARRMVESAKSGVVALRHAFLLKAKALGRAPGYEIRYQPMPDDRTFSVHEALVLADEVAAKLGPEYRRRLRERMAAGWLHLPPDPRKRGIFEVFPALGDGHPFMLTSYRSNFRSARQLTGALLDLMKSADTPMEGRPDGRDDPPTYGNGVLYAGDILFEDVLLAKDRARTERIQDLVSAIDLVFGNFYETAMMSELDAKVQALVVDGKPPSGAEISALYRGILKETLGEIPVDDVFGREWMLYSVTFLSYEHQFWGSAFAAGAVMAELVEAGDRHGLQALDEVYGRGDTDRSYGLLKMAGIDMATAAPYEAVHRRMARVSSELALVLGEGPFVLPPAPRTGALP